MRIQPPSAFEIRRKMTRSAPPERNVQSRLTSASGRHTAYPRAQKSKSPADISSISIEDIYQFAERERLNYSTSSRRQNLAHAQSQTSFFRHEQPVISRPNTSASRHMNSSRRETNTPMSAWSEPMISRPSSIIPHPELRDLVENEEQSEYDEEEEDFSFNMASHHTPMTVTFSPVSRDCCEVIGPQLCYECRKNRIRAVSKQRSEVYFPMLEPTEENLTTAAIVRKYLPGLSEPEIETKLARGEIARPTMFRKQNRHIEFSDEECDPKPKHTNKKVTIAEHSRQKKDNAQSITQKKPSELYFSNIRDLNNKIITGNVDRNVGFTNAVKPVVVQKENSPLKNHFPTFVSPRKVTMVQKTNYKTYFDPPLIDKAKQDVEPAFFAGSKQEYVLPEKLPDELVFIDKDGNEVKSSAAQGFTNKVSVSEEAAGQKTGKPKGQVRGSDVAEQKLGSVDPMTSLQEDEEEEDESHEESRVDDIREELDIIDEENLALLSTGESDIVQIGDTSMQDSANTGVAHEKPDVKENETYGVGVEENKTLESKENSMSTIEL